MSVRQSDPFISIDSHLVSELPTYDLVVPALLKVGIDGLKDNCSLTPGTLMNTELSFPHNECLIYWHASQVSH